jgi:hypothetical protein
MAALINQRNAELSARAESARSRMNLKKVNEEAELATKLAELRAKFNR